MTHHHPPGHHHHPGKGHRTEKRSRALTETRPVVGRSAGVDREGHQRTAERRDGPCCTRPLIELAGYPVVADQVGENPHAKSDNQRSDDVSAKVGWCRWLP
jgi:hypothetical protein